MTRDEIVAMDAAQLRLAIAKATGLYDYGVVAHQGNVEIYGWISIVDGKKYMGMNVPDWTNDIAAAWGLVEEANIYISLTRTNETNWYPAPWGEIHWRCRFGAPQHGEAFGDTAPLAICRAWLMWKASA